MPENRTIERHVGAHRHALALLALLVAAGLGAACSPSPTPAPEVVPLAEVPLENVLGLPILSVRVDESEPLVFLLDTGFDVSILDLEIAEGLGLKPDEMVAEAQPGGTIEAGSLPPATLRIGSLEIPDVALTALPIGGMAQFIGRPFHGIIGHDVLARFVVDLDYPAARLRWFDAESWQAPDGAEPIPVRVREGEPLVQARLIAADGREIPGEFKLDTGSFDVAGLNLNFVRDLDVLAAGQRELGAGGIAVGGETEGRLFRAGALILGSRRQQSPLIGYTVDSAGFENREDAGTIGVQLLARSGLVLDYPHEKIWFVGPTEPAPEEDRTGMLLVSPGPAFDALIVALVIPDGPAAEAGLAPGDFIVSLEGRTGLPLADARTLQRAEGPIEVVYRRADSEQRTTLERQRLLPPMPVDPGAGVD